MSPSLRDFFVEPAGPAGEREPRVEMVPPAVGERELLADGEPAALAGKRPLLAEHDLHRRPRPEAGASPRRAAVAVLAPPTRVQQATAAIAMGLARTCGSRCVLGHVIGSPVPAAASSSPLPAARAAASRLRGEGRAAVAAGRLVWVGTGEEPGDGASVEFLGLVGALGAPGALGVSVPRTADLDDMLAACDGLVVVREPDATAEVDALVRRSLAALGPAVATMAAPGRVAGQLAASGMHAPSAAVAAVREIGAGA